MRTIYKYPLKITDSQTIPIAGFESFCAAMLDPNGIPCIWCEVDTKSIFIREVEIFIVGTGNPIPEKANVFIGSFLMIPSVWHVYLEQR